MVKHPRNIKNKRINLDRSVTKHQAMLAPSLIWSPDSDQVLSQTGLRVLSHHVWPLQARPSILSLMQEQVKSKFFSYLIIE